MSTDPSFLFYIQIFSFESYRNVSNLTFLEASHNISLKIENEENEENLQLSESNKEILCQTWDFGSSGLLSYSALDPWLMITGKCIRKSCQKKEEPTCKTHCRHLGSWHCRLASQYRAQWSCNDIDCT